MRTYPVNTTEPRWMGWNRLRRDAVEPRVLSWLGDRGSLTRRVVRHCPGPFRVRVLRQGWGRPLPSERRLLRMRGGEIALLREVELLCGGRPWIFARSLIPVTSLRGPARRLARLGERPLGAVLFSDPDVARGGTEVARLLPIHFPFGAAGAYLAAAPGELWGRRTLFYVAGKPLLVNEIFLPALPG